MLVRVTSTLLLLELPFADIMSSVKNCLHSENLQNTFKKLVQQWLKGCVSVKKISSSERIYMLRSVTWKQSPKMSLPIPYEFFYCPGQCTIGEFQCTDRQCIRLESVCDRVRDCYDGSDEVNCPSQPTPEPTTPSMFQSLSSS